MGGVHAIVVRASRHVTESPSILGGVRALVDEAREEVRQQGPCQMPIEHELWPVVRLRAERPPPAAPVLQLLPRLDQSCREPKKARQSLDAEQAIAGHQAHQTSPTAEATRRPAPLLGARRPLSSVHAVVDLEGVRLEHV